MTGHRPRVLPLMLGDPVMANARATFARNIFGVAGFQILPEQRHETPEQAASAALDAEADIVVLCSADAAYTDIAAPICRQVAASEQAPMVVVAGYPEDAIDLLKRAGVDVFIHRKTHLLDALTDFQNRLNLTY
jgi:methylmalonyl-CoA mutase